jgi:hypothetical protein
MTGNDEQYLRDRPRIFAARDLARQQVMLCEIVLDTARPGEDVSKWHERRFLWSRRFVLLTAVLAARG